jgi:hypothetical protein
MKTTFSLMKKLSGDRIDLLFALLIFVLALLAVSQSFGQNVGINNATPHSRALLDLKSNDKGLLIPRMTMAERVAMFPAPDATAKGMLVYQTDAPAGMYQYNGTVWQSLSSSGEGWSVTGNTGTNPASNFVGTTDSISLVFRTKNQEAMRINPNGHVSIGWGGVFAKLTAVANETNYPVSCLMNNNAAGYTDEWFHGSDGYLKGRIGWGNPSYTGFANMFYAGSYVNAPFALITSNKERMRITGSGSIGIDTIAPQAKMHIKANSTVPWPHLLIDENDSLDFGRISFTNKGTSKYWTIASRANDNDTLSFYNIWNSSKGNILTVRGSGKVGIMNDYPNHPLQFGNVTGDKVVLYENAYGNYGLGIQGSLMQIHTAQQTDDVSFGYGTSMAFTETMRIKGNGFVGIGTSAPTSRLHVIGNEISVPVRIQNNLANGYTGIHYHSNAGNVMAHNGYANSGAATFANSYFSGSVASIPYIFTTSDQERMRIDANGNVGIGTTSTTSYRMNIFNNDLYSGVRIQNTLATGYSGIHFYSSNGSNMGHTGYGNASATLHPNTFYTGSIASIPYILTTGDIERVRVTETGNVGVGTSAPTTKFEVNGYTKLGSNAPAVKMLKVTGTTAAAQGGIVGITHGLNPAKILSVDVLLTLNVSSMLPPNYTYTAGNEYEYAVGASTINIYNVTGNSGNILSKPVRVLITYEE